jgi:GT2 family glycosyltransferase
MRGARRIPGMAYLRKLPSLGVVIPCRDNAWQLGGILKSLRYQTETPDAIVVVDDHSNPMEERLIRSLCRKFAVRYKRLPAPRSRRETLGRRSHARNAGSRELDTDVVLYLDGDMLLGPRYVEEIKRYHAALPQCYMRGQRYSIPASVQAKGMVVCLQVARCRLSGLESLSGYVVHPARLERPKVYKSAYRDRWEWCAGNNLSVRNEHASRIGYWDENFLGWGEEDIDFSFRLHGLGLMPVLLAGNHAASYHLEHPVDHEANASTLESNARYLINKFPEMAEYRKEAYARYDIDVEELMT